MVFKIKIPISECTESKFTPVDETKCKCWGGKRKRLDKYIYCYVCGEKLQHEAVFLNDAVGEFKGQKIKDETMDGISFYYGGGFGGCTIDICIKGYDVEFSIPSHNNITFEQVKLYFAHFYPEVTYEQIIYAFR